MCVGAFGMRKPRLWFVTLGGRVASHSDCATVLVEGTSTPSFMRQPSVSAIAASLSPEPFVGASAAPTGCGQAIARTEVFPEAASRTVTLGWRSRTTASAASCAAWACSRVSQNRTEAPRVGSSSERSQ